MTFLFYRNNLLEGSSRCGHLPTLAKEGIEGGDNKGSQVLNYGIKV